MGFTLTERFMAPTGWQEDEFVNPDTGHKIHFGHVAPPAPKAIVVCLGGLSEFAEKYFELAHDMQDRGYAFWFIDWAYQGRSGRLPDFPHRRHSDGFETDVSDLHYMMDNFVAPSTAADTPMIMLGHSMGGNIGLQFLVKYPAYFNAAAFSAPFLGIYNFTWPLKLIATLIEPILPIVGKMYIFKGSDWHENMRKGDGSEPFSSDQTRDMLHKYWSSTFPDLQVGSVTFGWVIKALKSCARLTTPGALDKIDIPVLIGVAGNDKIVDSAATRTIAPRLKRGRLLELKGARHEIFMESDIHRGAFLSAFDKMIEDNRIVSTHKNQPMENDMSEFAPNKERLSDRIIFALELAIQQKDVETAEILNHALEISMTRHTGGGEFIERRDYPREVEKMVEQIREMKSPSQP